MLEGIRELASKYDGFILDQYATAPFKESKIPPTQYIGGDVGARQQCLPSRCRSLSATQCMCRRASYLYLHHVSQVRGHAQRGLAA